MKKPNLNGKEIIALTVLTNIYGAVHKPDKPVRIAGQIMMTVADSVVLTTEKLDINSAPVSG